MTRKHDITCHNNEITKGTQIKFKPEYGPKFEGRSNLIRSTKFSKSKNNSVAGNQL
jgi:hypothetical protein